MTQRLEVAKPLRRPEPHDPYEQDHEESVGNYYEEIEEQPGPAVEVVGDGWIDDVHYG